MPIVSKTVEVAAEAALILSIVADFEAYPEWNDEVTGIWVLHRYNDGRPSQLRLDMKVSGFEGSFIQAVYYPGESQIQTVMQQGDLFSKQEQLFSVVAMGPASLLTVDMDVETSMPGVPAMMVKKLANDVLDHLADALKSRAEQFAAG
ncbi:cyclase [Mycolicibacterium insubricum]|jgi:ribosome-associated toxin RatA of RatAB toxin-antitoxin module|uniref:Cyclase n=1 Tax=Mycolicibacterium insubricum TaxID=444597 RepID=A0A1X0CZX7_9MYCO|nr:SRPBCC family protein [Mycolicibacterium insubricum]MCB9439612.1 SRPBCC family protein [Mycolicibacterium sp.]MCV7084028.1 SRPBCC family protein [Mycolicibacterium insubricum]ORA65707.1 cyclase [Mycolicibacterium insubricum]BBZ65333.1 cyclase [Mycolicibacterium insubricum]